MVAEQEAVQIQACRAERAQSWARAGPAWPLAAACQSVAESPWVAVAGGCEDGVATRVEVSDATMVCESDPQVSVSHSAIPLLSVAGD